MSALVEYRCGGCGGLRGATTVRICTHAAARTALTRAGRQVEREGARAADRLVEVGEAFAYAAGEVGGEVVLRANGNRRVGLDNAV